MDNESYWCKICKKVTNKQNIMMGINYCRECGVLNFDKAWDTDIDYFVDLDRLKTRRCPKCDSTNVILLERKGDRRTFVCIDCSEQQDHSLPNTFRCENPNCGIMIEFNSLNREQSSPRCPECLGYNLKGTNTFYWVCPICGEKVENHFIIIDNNGKGDRIVLCKKDNLMGQDPCFTMNRIKANLPENDLDKMHDAIYYSDGYLDLEHGCRWCGSPARKNWLCCISKECIEKELEQSNKDSQTYGDKK